VEAGTAGLPAGGLVCSNDSDLRSNPAALRYTATAVQNGTWDRNGTSLTVSERRWSGGQCVERCAGCCGV
jgi:hypothetical protein